MGEETNVPIKAELIELDRERKRDREEEREREKLRVKETDTGSNILKIFYNHFNIIIFDGKPF